MISRLQLLLRWVFMRVEALFNTAFGDRLNPLYHLGSITFMLFWLVAGSGLYLYAFFETGVAGAYASVDSLTHHQWYAGGIMRSVHRYASDAMVLTMLLHMLRHFAFDRMRGFRWFSWVSGVALIWGVYVSGVNGYMLPWDQLAQFVIVASFEWLDWLPGFGGTLMSQLHLPVQRQRPILLVAVFHAHRHTAGRAASDVDTRATRAEGKDQPAATAHVECGADAGSAVTGQAGAEPGWRGQPRRLPGQPATRLVLPCGLPAPLPVAARAGLGFAGCGHRGGHGVAVAAAELQAEQGWANSA